MSAVLYLGLCFTFNFEIVRIYVRGSACARRTIAKRCVCTSHDQIIGWARGHTSRRLHGCSPLGRQLQCAHAYLYKPPDLRQTLVLFYEDVPWRQRMCSCPRSTTLHCSMCRCIRDRSHTFHLPCIYCASLHMYSCHLRDRSATRHNVWSVPFANQISTYCPRHIILTLGTAALQWATWQYSGCVAPLAGVWFVPSTRTHTKRV